MIKTSLMIVGPEHLPRSSPILIVYRDWHKFLVFFTELLKLFAIEWAFKAYARTPMERGRNIRSVKLSGSFEDRRKCQIFLLIFESSHFVLISKELYYFSLKETSFSFILTIWKQIVSTRKAILLTGILSIFEVEAPVSKVQFMHIKNNFFC